MTRPRGRIEGGYVRKTISIPAALNDNIKVFLEANHEYTMSKLMTEAATNLLRTRKERKANR